VYATDFADRLKSRSFPALKAASSSSRTGTSHRLARAGVAASTRVAGELYGFAIARTSSSIEAGRRHAGQRVWQARGLDYWESGMDMSTQTISTTASAPTARGAGASMRRWRTSSTSGSSTRAAPSTDPGGAAEPGRGISSARRIKEWWAVNTDLHDRNGWKFLSASVSSCVA